MAKSPEQLRAEAKIASERNRTSLAVAEARATSSLDVAQRKALLSALSELREQRGNILVKQGQTTADYKATLVKAAEAYQQARDAGSKGRKMEALVALAKLMVEAPIKYADAAFAPNRGLLGKVADAVTTSPGATNEREKNRIAWETYLKYEVPGAGPVFGTYQAMVEQYGEPTESVNPNDDNGRLWRNLEAIKRKNEIERVEASRFEDGLRFVQDTGAAYEKYLEDTGKPDTPQTADEFYEAFGMDDKLPGLDDTKLVKTLASLADKPDALVDELFRKDFKGALEANQEGIEFFEGMLKDSAAGDTEQADTFRDKLAAWVGRPETRLWAEQRGFNIGETYPLTDALKAEIAEGKYPGAVYTKYGVYIPRKDDMKALNAALRDTKRDPSRNLLRAAGIGQGGGAPVEIDVKEGPSNATIVESGGYEGGLLGRLDNGQFVGSKDGKEWKILPGDAGERLLASGVQLTPDTEGIQVPVEPTTRTVLGIYRCPVYQDSPAPCATLTRARARKSCSPRNRSPLSVTQASGPPTRTRSAPRWRIPFVLPLRAAP